MTQYNSSFTSPIVFAPSKQSNGLCETVSKLGLTQFHVAETEKSTAATAPAQPRHRARSHAAAAPARTPPPRPHARRHRARSHAAAAAPIAPRAPHRRHTTNATYAAAGAAG